MQTAVQEAEALNEALIYGDQTTTLAQFAAAAPRLEAALHRCMTEGDVVSGLRLVGAMSRYWWMQGLAEQGWTWTQSVLEAATGHTEDAVAWASGLSGAGALARARGDYAQAGDLFSQALRREPDPLRQARLKDVLGIIRREQGRLDDAATLHTAALAALPENTAEAALAAHNLAVVAFLRGQYDTARRSHRRALQQRRTLGDTLGTASSLNNLGVIALFVDADPDAARPLLDEALSLRRSLGDTWGMAASISALGWVALLNEALDESRKRFEEGLASFRQVGDQLGVAESLEGLMAVAARSGDRTRGHALHEEATAIRSRLGVPLPEPRRALHEDAIRRLRESPPTDGST
ncbi:MAG: tetratricopeptide repeat protein [Myxococcota bacterium]